TRWAQKWQKLDCLGARNAIYLVKLTRECVQETRTVTPLASPRDFKVEIAMAFVEDAFAVKANGFTLHQQ
ncbi:hypothetical protein SOVF_046970, partial [Spinacia oleracea]